MSGQLQVQGLPLPPAESTKPTCSPLSVPLSPPDIGVMVVAGILLNLKSVSFCCDCTAHLQQCGGARMIDKHAHDEHADACNTVLCVLAKHHSHFWLIDDSKSPGGGAHSPK
eukprot:2272017-Rhodomonas_salina.1